MAEQSGIVKGLIDEDTDSSTLNQLSFLIKLLQQQISTTALVRVMSVQAGDTAAAGYVDILPLVSQIDAWGNAIPMTTLHHVPYFRLQAGRVGIVIDPVPGDIGIAVFAQNDISGVKQGQSETVRPGSWRQHDQADGLYLGGVLNLGVDTFLRLTQDKKITLTAPGGLTIDTPTATFTGDIVCGGFSYLGHTHTGVHGETTPPH